MFSSSKMCIRTVAPQIWTSVGMSFVCSCFSLSVCLLSTSKLENNYATLYCLFTASVALENARDCAVLSQVQCHT